MDQIIADRYYSYAIQSDFMARLASTKFHAFLYTKFDERISSDSPMRFILLSGHDSTIAAFLAGVEQRKLVQPFFASSILVELWKKDSTEGAQPEDFYIKYIYDGEPQKLGDFCDEQGRCVYPAFKAYLQEREVEDFEGTCEVPESYTAVRGQG